MTAALLVAALVAFAATTVDDLVIVTALFTAGCTAGRPSRGTIITGQYGGFGAIVGVSLAAAAGLRVIPDRWIGLLGLVPIAYGIFGLWQLWRSDDENSRPAIASTATGIATVTFTNGADNISVFTPLFRSLHPTGAIVTAVAFLVMVGVWCGLGAVLGSHRAVIANLAGSHWLVPAVFILIGVLVLITTGAATLITYTI